jgi:hypothetical protein
VINFDHLLLFFLATFQPLLADAAGLFFAFVAAIVVSEAIYHAFRGSKNPQKGGE